MRFTIRHETVYRYATPVKHSIQLLRLTPRREGRQSVLRWVIHAPGRRIEQVDAHGNITHLLTLEQPHREIAIVVDGEIEVIDEPELPNEGLLAPLAYRSPTALTAPDAAIRDLATRHLAGGATRAALHALAEEIHGRIRYTPGVTGVEETAAAALARGEGVCQDHAHVFIACCRAAGVPARYVSGYFYADTGSDLASHAWADVWLAREGLWRSVDATHLSPAGTAHCRLAVGRDYLDAAPVRGVRRGGGDEAMAVRVQIVTPAQ
jgi:transglutaminase-like putative cysteine protease